MLLNPCETPMSIISPSLIESLPKTDLHCHLDGSLRLTTLIELAAKNGVKLPNSEQQAIMHYYQYGRVRKSLEEYLLGFEPLVAVMQKAEDIERVFFEVCEDAARENVWHLELRYCPYLHTRQGLSLVEVVEACIRGARRAEQDLAISVGQILCGLKHNDRATILEVAQLAVQFRKQGVVGFDLAGPEHGFPIKDHLEAIYFAKKHHLFITLHAGESYGPASIFQAIHDAGAHRVGHGTSLLGDAELLAYVIDHRIGIECCPTSNWHTGAVSSLEQHPLKSLLSAGARVSINTDNRLCSNTSITKEILTMIEYLGLDLSDIKRLLINGFKSAFLTYDQRSIMLKKFNKIWDDLIGYRA